VTDEKGPEADKHNEGYECMTYIMAPGKGLVSSVKSDILRKRAETEVMP